MRSVRSVWYWLFCRQPISGKLGFYLTTSLRFKYILLSLWFVHFDSMMTFDCRKFWILIWPHLSLLCCCAFFFLFEKFFLTLMLSSVFWKVFGFAFPSGSAGKKSALQYRWPGFEPWVGKIPWRRERLPTPILWPGEFHGHYSPWGSQRIGHSWATCTFTLRSLNLLELLCMV